MSKYLIEIPHDSSGLGCLRSISVLLSTGSHFLTNADFGCGDGEHKAWFFMEAESKDECLRIVPPAFRKDEKYPCLINLSLKMLISSSGNTRIPDRIFCTKRFTSSRFCQCRRGVESFEGRSFHC